MIKGVNVSALQLIHDDANNIEPKAVGRWFFDESTENFKRHWTRVAPVKDAKKIDFQVDEIDTKHAYEIDTTKLTHGIPPQTARIVDLLSFKTQRSKRYFLLSVYYQALHIATKEKEKVIPAKRVNRVKNGYKKELHAAHMKYKNEWLEINGTEEKGIYPTMLTEIIKQLDIALQIHGRVIAIRFDLHQVDYTEKKHGDDQV